MKRLIIILLAIVPIIASSQTQQSQVQQSREQQSHELRNTPLTFDQLQKKYISRDGYTVVRVTSSMLKLSGLADLGGVDEIRIITADKFNEGFYNDMARVIRQPGYDLLTVVEEKDQMAGFYFRKTSSGRIFDLVMIVRGTKDNLIMTITGDFSISQIRSIASKVSPVKSK